MDDKDRETVLAALVADTPKRFWEDLAAKTRQTYADEFLQVAHNPNFIAEQKIDALLQSRHFRMENLLDTLARDHGLASSRTLLIKNNRSYIYVSAGVVGMTQAYVQTIGEMPKPAKFREHRASMNRIAREPGLMIGADDVPELFELKEFYGIIAHNPAGRRFDEQQQAMGMIQFCVPNSDCSAWIVELTLHEIVAAYPAAEARREDRDLQWKGRAAEKGADGGQ